MGDYEELAKETEEILTKHEKTWKDVRWIGDDRGCIDVKEFRKRADRRYDSGFGGQEVNPKLKVVGDDWWLERHEYDGSEWWEFKELPVQPKILGTWIFEAEKDDDDD